MSGWKKICLRRTVVQTLKPLKQTLCSTIFMHYVGPYVCGVQCSYLNSWMKWYPTLCNATWRDVGLRVYPSFCLYVCLHVCTHVPTLTFYAWNAMTSALTARTHPHYCAETASNYSNWKSSAWIITSCATNALPALGWEHMCLVEVRIRQP